MCSRFKMSGSSFKCRVVSAQFIFVLICPSLLLPQILSISLLVIYININRNQGWEPGERQNKGGWKIMTSLSLSQKDSLFFEHLIFPHLQVCHIPYLCMVHHPSCMGQRMRCGDSRVPDSSWVHYHPSTRECLGNLDLGGRFRNTGSLVGLRHHLGSGKETAFPE